MDVRISRPILRYWEIVHEPLSLLLTTPVGVATRPAVGANFVQMRIGDFRTYRRELSCQNSLLVRRYQRGGDVKSERSSGVLGAEPRLGNAANAKAGDREQAAAQHAVAGETRQRRL